MPLNEMRFLLPLLSLALLGGWLLTGWVLLRRERLLQGRVDELLEQNRSQQLEMHQQLGAQLSLETRLEHLQESVARLDAERGRLATRLADAEGQCNEWQRSAERFQVQAQEQQRQGELLQTERRTLEQRLQQLQQTHEQLRVEHSTLQTTLSQRQQHFDEQQQLLKDSREQLKLEFEQLAGRIFEAKGQTFTQTSQQSLDALLKPFREQIDQFRSKVE